MNPQKEHLQPTPIINSDHESVIAFARENAGKSDNPVDQAVSLYYAVRDGIRYNPYKFVLTVEGLKASTTLEVGEAWCVPKAALLAACCRVMGIPARVGYADVRNHLSTKRMREQMQTNVFHWHGYNTIYLNGKWVKATPAFNVELCEKFRLRTLEFDGENDSIYHPFDLDGNKHMDYINFRGEYDDVPLAEMIKTFQGLYGEDAFANVDEDFDADVAREEMD
ncbi:Transglutaminase-like superfamily protein [Desulfatibacillum alkenivorans DSM 16219]|jgi:transglutaminase-like putative cysteine protease|uniref:Transglutaminase-like superfamily protein n=1 Tax=Desulfatibacillum alkenivorans DSM 16219 TaxID=1121393 RepID=A0A1M6WIB7_9BACT|nr:transglutaminase family protein [Desulfatibacillum alkenivorans]SHK93374.1 Transglutaminase-like superfamily protein [Desulfatibacillum alkenivorans DSM 16219]